MNKRIRELEERCWEELGEEECYYPVFNREKFAELIVLECADLYENEANNWFGTDSKDVLKLYSEKLKRHFGVE